MHGGRSTMWGWTIGVWDSIAFWTLIAGSLLAGAGLALTAFSSIISLRTAAIVQQGADLKIAEAIAQSDSAKAAAARANEGAAAANARAAEAQLALARLKEPRTLDASSRGILASTLKQFQGQRFRAAISQGADDGIAFWESLYAALKEAGWVYIPAESPSIGMPPAGIPLAAIPGVEVRFDPAKEAELKGAALALGNGLNALGKVVEVNREQVSYASEDLQETLFLVIGARVVSK